MPQELNMNDKGEDDTASSFSVQKNPLEIVLEKIFTYELPPMNKPEWVCDECHDELCREGHGKRLWEFPAFNFMNRPCSMCHENVGTHYLCDGVPE